MNAVGEAYKNKLKNRLYGCLCEREADREWESYLDSILVELMGWPDDEKGINFYKMWYKLTACRYLSYKYFRKTIVDVRTMLGGSAKEA